MAEHSAVNRRVVGSSPTSGANKIPKVNNLAGRFQEAPFPPNTLFYPHFCYSPATKLLQCWQGEYARTLNLVWLNFAT